MGKFKAGAVVKLNTGNGPIMSVQGPVSANSASLNCKWFFENKVLHDIFHEDSLVEASPEDKASLKVSFVSGSEDEPPAQK